MRKREPGHRTGGAGLALAVAGVAMILVLGGCGQSGPLYLPKKSSLSAAAPPTVPDSPAVAGRPGAIRGGPGPSRDRLTTPGPESGLISIA